MQNTIHFVLQAKGGIGKSFVSALLAQYLLRETGAVRCFDTDQENTTFTHYEALGVRHVTVTNASRLIEPKKFDALMETLLMKSYPGRILLALDETAHACGLAPGTIRTRPSRKTFPVAHRKVGDKTLFYIEAVARFIDGLPSVGKRGRGRPPKVESLPA